MRERQRNSMFPILAFVAGMTLAGCATLSPQGQSLVPTQYRTRTGPYAVFSNFPIAADSPAIHSLHSLENDVEAHLGVRINSKEAPIEVYILNDRQSFAHFLKFYYPELPSRRAFFLAQGNQRVVFTFRGERLEEDLRHEATHALLNVAYGDLPLWLDEGLAEYFESPTTHHGLNQEHLQRLPNDLASGWRPDLARLETLKSVRQMAPRDYRESWAWIHYLLSGSNEGKSVLLGYLADRRTGQSIKPLSEQLRSRADSNPATLITYLSQVRTAPIAGNPTSAETTVRLQDNVLESGKSRPSAPRRSFLGRLGSYFGF